MTLFTRPWPRPRAALLAVVALVAFAGCDRRVMPTPDGVDAAQVSPPAPSGSATAAPSSSAASLAVPAQPGCAFVPLDGRAVFRDDLRWLALARDPGDGNGFPTFYTVELTGGAAAHALVGTLEGSPYQRDWTPDRKTLVTFTSFHTGRAQLELWDTASWTLRASASVYCAGVAEISGDGTWLAAVGCEGHHVVLDTRPGAREERWLRGGMRAAADVDIAGVQSPDSKAWLVADHDGQVELFGVHPLRLRRVVVQPGDENMTAVAWSPDGRAFATAEADGAVRLWDASGALKKVAQKPLGKQGEHRTTLAWGPDGVLATAELDGVVHLWDGATGAPAGTLGTPRPPGDPGDHASAAPSFLGKGRVRLCAGADGKERATFFELPSGRVLFERDGCGSPSPDGAHLWFDAPGHLEIVDPGTGAVTQRLDWPTDAEGVQWTRDGRFVTWMEGATRNQGWDGHTVRAARIADGASLWLALLDGPGGPRLVARGEDGAYTGDSATCLPGPPIGSAPQQRPALIAEFFAGSR